MLIELTIKNFYSFKDEATLSMVASNITEFEENIIHTDTDLNLLKSSAIYGANASGKSNFLKAFSFIKGFVLNSSKESQMGEEIPFFPFLLDKQSSKEPTFFEIVFLINKIRYRYGFEVTTKEVISEWLFHARKRETRLFFRDKEGIQTSSAFKEGSKSLIQKTRNNALFLSVCAQFNGTISTSIMNWFNSLAQLFTDVDENYRTFSLNQIKNNSNLKPKMLNLLKNFDVGILDISVEEMEFEKDILKSEVEEKILELLNGEVRGDKIIYEDVGTIHTFFDGEEPHGTKRLPWGFESSGTNKLLNISGPIFDSLSSGLILVIDEIDIRLHPMITRELIKLFHSKTTNPKNAQLIFATHDPKLMSGELFRRDQIWFTEKDQFGSSQLFSLVEFKTRKETNIEKAYLNGRFGGIPYIKNIVNEFSKENC